MAGCANGVTVPEAVRQHPEVPVPLVFACHGYTCNGAIYMENSGWNRVADENGFVVVYPTAGYGQILCRKCLLQQ